MLKYPIELARCSRTIEPVNEHPAERVGAAYGPCDFPVFCDSQSGDADDAVHGVRMEPIQPSYGENVNVVMVDNGIQSQWVKAESIEFSPRREPFQGDAEHGTKMAAIVRKLAPAATLWDCPLLPVRPDEQEQIGLFLDAATKAYQAIRTKIDNDPKAHWVVVNCWSLPNKPGDGYSSDPEHPFTKEVVALVQSGVDVLFAAGNCGGECSGTDPGKCGLTGPGKSISGVNAHPSVITIGAVTVPMRLPGKPGEYDYWWGHSSIGPGTLLIDGAYSQKPDLCCPSIFVLTATAIDGSSSKQYFRCGGTSSAAAVCGGVVAALRSLSGGKALTAKDLKGILIATAREPLNKPPPNPGWNPYFGYGVPDFEEAKNRL